MLALQIIDHYAVRLSPIVHGKSDVAETRMEGGARGLESNGWTD